MNLKVSQVVGLNTDQKAAQVISLSRDGDNTFFAVLEVTSDDAFTRGRQVLSELADFYFDFEGSPSEKLNATFTKAGEKLTDGDFSLLLASSSGKVLYLISKGEVEIYLKRAEKLSPLLLVGAPTQLISGFLENGDRLLISTKSLVSFLGEDLNKSISLPLESFEQDIADRIGASNLENQGLAALLVEIEDEQMNQEINKSRLDQDQIDEDIPGLEKDQDVEKIFSENKLIGLLSQVKKLRNYFPKSGRSRLILAAVIIIIIALGVGVKVKALKDAERNSAFAQAMQQAKDDFNTAKDLASLNPVDAKSKLDLAKSEVNKALALKPKDGDAQNLKKQIDEDSDSILKQSSVSKFPEFLDLDLIKKNFRANQMSLSDGKLMLLDPGVKTLVTIDLSKKSNQILAGSEKLGDASIASLNGSTAFVYSKDKGVLKLDTSSKKITSVTKNDSEWGQIIDIYGFASNVYVLDSGNPPAGGMIWKYLPTSDGYSDKREYLNKGVKVDFSNLLRMQIESSIYILKKGGEILRFTKGDKDNFGLEGLDKGVKDPKSIFVSSDTDNLYVLDSGNSRLLILTKTGSYKGQISGSGFGTASDLVVDEKGKKVYLLDGSKIYSVDLK